MLELKLNRIVEVGQSRYCVTFVDEHGAETEVVCQLEEDGDIRFWNPITELKPDIFMLGYADIRATGRVLFEHHDRKRRGGV